MNKRDVKDPFYGIGDKYNKRVIIVDPNGVATIITREEYQDMIHCRKERDGVHIIRQVR